MTRKCISNFPDTTLRRKLRKQTRKNVLEDGTEVEVEVDVDEEGNGVENKFVGILDSLENKYVYCPILVGLVCHLHGSILTIVIK